MSERSMRAFSTALGSRAGFGSVGCRGSLRYGVSAAQRFSADAAHAGTAHANRKIRQMIFLVNEFAGDIGARKVVG